MRCPRRKGEGPKCVICLRPQPAPVYVIRPSLRANPFKPRVLDAGVPVDRMVNTGRRTSCTSGQGHEALPLTCYLFLRTPTTEPDLVGQLRQSGRCGISSPGSRPTSTARVSADLP